MSVDDDRDPEEDRDRLDDPPDHVLRHRLTAFCMCRKKLTLRFVVRGQGGRFGAANGTPALWTGSGRPRSGRPERSNSISEPRPSRSAFDPVPVDGVPGRAGLGRVREEVAERRADELDVLAVVERDLDRLLDVDLLELGHGVLDDREVDAVLDGVERRVDVRVLDLGVVRAVRLELAAVVAEVVAERVDRAREGVLGEVEVALREGARRVARSPRCSRRRSSSAVDRVDDRLDADVLQPAGDQGERVDPDLPGRRAELDLGLEAVLLADAVAVTVRPAGGVEDLLGLLGVEGGRRLVREEPRTGGDVRVARPGRCRPGAGC